MIYYDMIWIYFVIILLRKNQQLILFENNILYTWYYSPFTQLILMVHSPTQHHHDFSNVNIYIYIHHILFEEIKLQVRLKLLFPPLQSNSPRHTLVIHLLSSGFVLAGGSLSGLVFLDKSGDGKVDSTCPQAFFQSCFQFLPHSHIYPQFAN